MSMSLHTQSLFPYDTNITRSCFHCLLFLHAFVNISYCITKLFVQQQSLEQLFSLAVKTEC